MWDGEICAEKRLEMVYYATWQKDIVELLMSII